MPDTSAHPTTPIRSRSAVACQACRQRKVRCSLAVTGNPCIGCTQDGAECIVVPKQRRKYQRPRAQRNQRRDQGSLQAPDPVFTGSTMTHRPSDHEPTPTTDHSMLSNGPAEAIGIPGASSSANEGDHSEGRRRVGIEVAPSSLLLPQGVNSTTAQARNEGGVEDAERRGIEIAAARLGQPQSLGQVPYYTGSQTGPTFALDICSPDKSLPRHLLVPSSTRPLFSDADQNYLRAKGALTLPGKESCEALLRAYLNHVHPIMPVIEIDHILDYQHNGRLSEYNILLLWCIFLAAANFVHPTIYEQEGYKSRQEMKALMYSRAKCTYAISEGMDKIVLLQASLLMSFWLSELDEHMQPWYWVGTAITFCQMLGLHRNPDSSKINSAISDQQRRLWRRLWWCSFYRDCWLGFHFGRPLRIDLNDCDTPMPLVTDMLDDLAGIPESTSTDFLPKDLPRLASYWVRMIELSKQLGAVITMNYKTIRAKPTIQQFETLEAEILKYELPDPYESGLVNLVRFHLFHVHLHYQVLLIALYRPYGSETLTGLDPAQQGDWQHRMRMKAGDAASRTNDILDALAQDDLLQFAGPMTPALLVPAMQTHLLFYKSADSLTKRLRLHKLEMCMLVMEELQKNYTVASLYRGIFLRAMQQICPPYQRGTGASDQTVNFVPASDSSDRNYTVNQPATGRFVTDHFGNNAPLGDFSEQGTETFGDFVDSLMDESSMFNLWETWNRI